ncbi:hypothetical protein L218DRAFT_939865 [Marasmius fiardii PR-910]|nr:hypothetical protein L218DRAFT_939865 [Marasmius fiardii PR-910]
MRVFYRSNAPVAGFNDISTIDGRPVSGEDLSRLGIKAVKLGTGPEAQAQAKSVARSAKKVKDFSIVLDVRPNWTVPSVLFKHQCQALLLSGKIYVDIQLQGRADSNNKQWIRLEVTAGDFVCLPANCLLRVGLDMDTFRELSALIAMNRDKGNVDVLFSGANMAFGKDIEKHRSKL